jgi:hypothetical protein
MEIKQEDQDPLNPCIKHVVMVPLPIQIKTVKSQKEKRMRMETKTWGLVPDDLLHETQLNIIQTIVENVVTTDKKYRAFLVSHIKSKISGYKQQDISKSKYQENVFITYPYVVKMLCESYMKCHYCCENTYILYEKVRENKQWTLDRVDNDSGHNAGNVVIACLECNLKRKRTNKDAFLFTKKMVLVKRNETNIHEGEE